MTNLKIPDPPGQIPAEPVVADSGKTHLSLHWLRPPCANSAPVTSYRIDVWMMGKDGGAIWRDVGRSPINSFDIFNLKIGADYLFRVTPRNRYGWGPSAQTSYPVTFGAGIQLPEFVKILPGQLKALIGTETVLECHVKGVPRPKIVWYKDGMAIPDDVEDHRIIIHNEGHYCKLIFTKTIETDSGRYSCEATNSEGRVSTFARVQVVCDRKIYEADHYLKRIVDVEIEHMKEMAPQFTMRLRDRRVQATYPVRLTIQSIGAPAPQITWFKDGEPVQEDGKYLHVGIFSFNNITSS